jgi:trimeric autotransporter adhesin
MCKLFAFFSLFLILAFAGQSFAQQTQATPAPSDTSASLVPRLIKFSGVLLDRQGQPLKGPVGVTFSLYAQQSGDAPLWMETQNVELDAKGFYTVLLGANGSTGLPEEMFRSGEARWLGVQPERETELPRVLLVSVPYALKAGDAQTLGGLPPSAFAPANFSAPANAPSLSSTLGVLLAAPVGPPEAGTTGGSATAPTGGGTTNFIPRWTSSTNLGNSILFQSTTSNVNVNGSLSLPALKAATALAGANSQPLDLLSSVFSSSTHAAVSQHFRWQAEPVGNNTTSPSGKFNLLYAAGTAAPAETGLSISNRGLITFASGQTLPTVTGNETVTGNVSANQLQSNVATGTAPFVVKSTTLVANLNASFLGGLPAGSFATRGANVFTSFQSIAGNGLSMYIGDVACPAGSIGIQAQAFSFGCGNFALMLDTSGNTVVNRPPGGGIHFRESNGADQMTITTGGNVGIGTSAPIAQLQVQAASGHHGISATGSNAPTNSADGGVGVIAVGGDALSGTVSNGGFGIAAIGGKNGDGTPQVAGEFIGDVIVDGCISASGTVIGGTCQSDARLKKNIQPYSPVLDKLVRLQPVTYSWRAEKYPQYRFGTEKSSGLIAQEVEKVFPELVSVDAGGFRRVNYGELPLLMLQAIRELNAENNKLQEEMKVRETEWEERFRAQEERANLQQMQQQVAALEARLARVESEGGSNQASAAPREVPKRNDGGGRL